MCEASEAVIFGICYSSVSVAFVTHQATATKAIHTDALLQLAKLAGVSSCYRPHVRASILQ